MIARGATLHTRVVASPSHGPIPHDSAATWLQNGDHPPVTIVVPALNEVDSLPDLLFLIPSGYEVIVVDGGSTDGTMDAARAARPDATVFRQSRSGKGNALFSGFAAAQGDILITLDADGSHSIDELPRFIEALMSGADFAKGSRLMRGGGSADFTWFRAAGTRALGAAANVIHGTRYTDLTYGYNGFWRHAIPHIVSDADGFEGEVLMYIRAARAGLRVAEVPCFEGPRTAGVSKLSAVRDGLRVLKAIVNERNAAPSPEIHTREVEPWSVRQNGYELSGGERADHDLADRARRLVAAPKLDEVSLAEE